MKLDFAFVPFPREIWTESIDLTQAEFRLLGWFCCNLRFGTSQPDIADEQILDGYHSGECGYPPCGLSRNSMKRSRESLMSRGFLLATPKLGGGGRGKSAVWSYSINLSSSDKFTHKPVKDGQYTCPTLTINPSNFDNVIRKIEEPERAELTLSPPSSEVVSKKSKSQDPRHAIFRDKLEKFWAWFNPDLRLSWGPAEAGQLGLFLKKWPELTAEEFRTWLLNYSDSDEVVTTKTPKQFLPVLHEYANSPLNKFHKPKDDHAQA